MKSYQTYLFDLDGTLISTIDLICKCFQFSLKKYLNIDVPRHDILLKIGLPLKQQFTLFIKDAGLNSQNFDLNQMAKDHMDYQLQIWQQYVYSYDYAKEVMISLKKNFKQVGVVTSRLAQTATLYLEHTGLRRYCDCLITPESTQLHKPHPEPVQTAIKKLKADMSRSIMIGDSLFDIQCGHAAGIDTVWIVHSDSPWLETSGDKNLSKQKPAQLATYTISELQSLLPSEKLD